MPEPPSPGRYPPDDIWRFPLPPVSRWWLVAAIVSGVLGLVTFGGAMTYLSLNTNRDIPGFIDDPEVVKIPTEECRLMRSSITGLALDGPREARLDALTDQNTAIRTMVERIRAVERTVRAADRPLDRWLDDWEKLASGRETYIDRQRRGDDSRFRVPRSPDGEPINERMDVAGAEICRVPKTLLRPDLAGAQPV